ncbi:PAC2 family protein [Corynebacterium breve]|uniref:PAC2 family protein n=1 Tax=Corynebacterium breve TaxID=3049799 RepID=A0ABY8VCC2_9CORY|nr:PAC2 family protein [Corynebacterium breve]WIM66767.1 PAC2 family protein [Corynebacterium breve]
MADDTRRMYEMEYPAPPVGDTSQHGPTLIIAMQGYADAGHAVESAAEHLKAALDNSQVATFNADELIDYRSRRPAVMMEKHEITNMEKIELDMRVVRDSEGENFLLLSGPEPDLRWEGFSQAVADLADKYNVSKTICLYGAPMAVPHTRPLMVSAHGNDRDLVGTMFSFDGKVTMPGSASLMIERELHARGHAVAGYTAHVPHYLAQSPYPHATFQLLQSVSDTSKLKFPLKALEHDMNVVAKQLTEQTAGSEEIMHVVTQLEKHYDQELAEYRKTHPNAMMPGESQVPSGEEIGAAFENYLAAVDDRERTRPELPHAKQLFNFDSNEQAADDPSLGDDSPAPDADSESEADGQGTTDES